jgi:uncharacterized membrane protein HdeD (DUF308 family)
MSIPLIVRGILAVVVGIIAATWPSITVFALVIVLAVDACLIFGVWEMVAGVELRHSGRDLGLSGSAA